MPGFDGTGPRGMGPMTGGGRGFCAIPLRPAWSAYHGRGFPMTHAMHWGMPYYGAHPFMLQTSREEELDYLKTLAKSMMDDMKEVEARIQKIERKEE